MKKRLLVVLALLLCVCVTFVGCGEEPTVVENGQKVTVADSYEFVIDSWNHGDKIEGKRNANSSYSYSPIDHIAFVEIEYTNLSNETISSSNIFGGSEMDGELTVDGTSYPISTYAPSDIVALAEGTVYICYTVPADVIENATEKIATFRIGDVLYQYVMVDDQVMVVSSDAVEIKKGDVVTGDSYEFKVDGIASGSELSVKGGNITHSYSPSDYMMWIELDFKNLGTAPLETWDCPLFEDGKYELIYDGKYEYVGGTWFAEDIPALGSSKVFVYFEVPENVKNSEGTKVATFEIGGDEYMYNF